MSEVMNIGGEEGIESQNTPVLICSSSCSSWGCKLVVGSLLQGFLLKDNLGSQFATLSLQNDLSCQEQCYGGQRCLKWPGLRWVWLDCFSVNKNSSVCH